MQIGVPKEILAGETRVAATPKTVEQLLKMGFDVAIESNAGALASFDDVAYENAGANIVTTEEVWTADLILKVNAPSDNEIDALNDGASLISFVWPAQKPELMEKLSRLSSRSCEIRKSTKQSSEANLSLDHLFINKSPDADLKTAF